MNNDKANEYNRARGHSPAIWRKIQTVLGAIPSGEPDDNTANAARRYQTAHGLEIDGCVGPITLGALGLAGPCPNQRRPAPKRGLWYDMRPRETLKNLARTIARLRLMGFGAVSVMLDSAKPTTEPRFKWTPEQLEKFAHECRASDIKFGFTLWPRPTVAHMGALAEALPDYVSLTAPDFIELDVEGNWETRDVKDFDSLASAGADLVSLLREICPAAQLGATSFPYHREYGGSPTVSQLVDVITPQAYSVFKPSKPKYAWGEAYGPVTMQRLAFARAQRVQPPPIMNMGLAAWAQKFPGRSVFETMRATSDEAARLGIDRVWYWSAKWLLRHWDKANERRRYLITNKPGV